MSSRDHGRARLEMFLESAGHELTLGVAETAHRLRDVEMSHDDILIWRNLRQSTQETRLPSCHTVLYLPCAITVPARKLGYRAAIRRRRGAA